MEYVKSALTIADDSAHAALRFAAQSFYENTLKALERTRNDRLWFKTQLKLCNLWFKRGEYGRMGRILKELHRSCEREDGSEDPKKGTQLLEVRAHGTWLAACSTRSMRTRAPACAHAAGACALMCVHVCVSVCQHRMFVRII